LAGLALVGLLILPVIILLLVGVSGRIASGKQVTMDRAQASLLAALDDFQAVGGAGGFVPKYYNGHFQVIACGTNNVVIEGRNYQCALYTGQQYQFIGQGHLAITTNREFIWLDNRRGPKLIPPDYKVSRWRPGY
jgi:hypothetical protein